MCTLFVMKGTKRVYVCSDLRIIRMGMDLRIIRTGMDLRIIRTGMDLRIIRTGMDLNIMREGMDLCSGSSVMCVNIYTLELHNVSTCEDGSRSTGSLLGPGLAAPSFGCSIRGPGLAAPSFGCSIRGPGLAAPSFGCSIRGPGLAAPSFGCSIRGPGLAAPSFGCSIRGPGLAAPSFGCSIRGPGLAAPSFGCSIRVPGVAAPSFGCSIPGSSVLDCTSNDGEAGSASQSSGSSSLDVSTSSAGICSSGFGCPFKTAIFCLRAAICRASFLTSTSRLVKARAMTLALGCRLNASPVSSLEIRMQRIKKMYDAWGLCQTKSKTFVQVLDLHPTNNLFFGKHDLYGYRSSHNVYSFTTNTLCAGIDI